MCIVHTWPVQLCLNLGLLNQLNKQNGLGKTIMQGMVAGIESEESQDREGRKTSQIYIFGRMATSSRVAKRFRQRRPEEDTLSEEGGDNV